MVRMRGRWLWAMVPMSTLFVAFVLHLLVSLSLPIIKSLYIVQFTATPTVSQPPTNIATTLRFGVWGLCGTSVLDQPTSSGVCSPPHLGYNFDPAFLADTGYAVVAQAVEEVLTVVLVMHPIAAGLTLLALVCAIPGIQLHAFEILTLVITVVAAIATTVAMAVDFALIAEMQTRVGAFVALQVGIGNCPWMMVATVILLWLSVIGESIVSCNCFGMGRRRDWDPKPSY